ncbi:MAG TPA: bifunctional demethylmenaquinone methyltransferase/2-methoxy-6-polyprenyl-1,4-benzoquinol methylase UbiE [Gemmatimonadaceae bacterium]|jgi:demethylmenaquinone methyltransferase/2-methoxy-6-polyprenyl-1,4-benzoquinol methylase|nr:bifunctional demethylmenaquinone methyltransferase/2-methoxy-6-polyprenyl-1,4-benzoquinol methylase UbiE [Gemmatimonadaceae bacterium]
MLVDAKRQHIQRMFSEIAPRYDLLNHLLSFNVDRSWRRRALAALAWERSPSGTYVDLCAGTLDVSAALAAQPRFSGRVIGADFAEPMLRAGASKSRASISPVVADALDLPLRDESADGAIVAFGIRNVEHLDAALTEALRVLKPGARFVILEFSTPPSPMIRTAYHAYFHHVLPAIGGAVSGHGAAYRYLPRSVAQFPSAPELAARLDAAGFARVTWEPLTFGVAALHVGQRP